MTRCARAEEIFSSRQKRRWTIRRQAREFPLEGLRDGIVDVQDQLLAEQAREDSGKYEEIRHVVDVYDIHLALEKAAAAGDKGLKEKSQVQGHIGRLVLPPVLPGIQLDDRNPVSLIGPGLAVFGKHEKRHPFSAPGKGLRLAPDPGIVLEKGACKH